MPASRFPFLAFDAINGDLQRDTAFLQAFARNVTLVLAQHHSHADTACLKERSLCEPVPILAEGEFDRIRRRCVLDQCSVLHQRGEAAFDRDFQIIRLLLRH